MKFMISSSHKLSVTSTVGPVVKQYRGNEKKELFELYSTETGLTSNLFMLSKFLN